MRDESTKQAAQEYLAAKLSDEEQRYEDELNNALAERRSLHFWKEIRDMVLKKCKEWNEVTGEETLTCKETMMGDLRVVCAAKAKQLIVRFESRRRLITFVNGGRAEHEKDVILRMEGYRTGPDRNDRDIRMILNGEPVNLDNMLLGEMRVLTGMKRQR
jgi:hypothetical protein